MKKILTPNTSKGMESVDEEYDLGLGVGHGMETFGWRGDNVRGADVEVKGGADVGIEERDIGELAAEAGGMGIVKTTQFTVEEQDANSLYEKKWSNV